MSVEQGEPRDSSIYMNSGDNSNTVVYCNTSPTPNRNYPVAAAKPDEPVYSLAGPIIDDLIVVDNDFYEA